ESIQFRLEIRPRRRLRFLRPPIEDVHRYPASFGLDHLIWPVDRNGYCRRIRLRLARPRRRLRPRSHPTRGRHPALDTRRAPSSANAIPLLNQHHRWNRWYEEGPLKGPWG